MSKKRYPRLFGILPFLGMLLLSGCNWTLLDPKGQVGIEQKNLILIATGLMLLVVIPVIIMTVVFAWKYLTGRTRPRSKPRCGSSRS